MDSVAAMRMLVRVVDSGSFSAAARQLGIAPSSVSRQINELEEDLGARLFARTTRKLSLTEAGQLYYERVSNIINEVDEAKLALSQLGSPSGILRVTVPSGIGRELVVSAVPGFSKVRESEDFFARNADAIVAATVAGLGVSLLPDCNMGTELRQKQLRAVLEDYEAIPATSPVYAVHAHQRHVPPKIRVFIEFLIETFPKARYS